MKRALRALTAASVAVSLAACGTFGPTSGTVIERDYDDADRYRSTCSETHYRWENRPVTRTTTVNGKTSTRTTYRQKYVPYQVSFPCTKHDPEHYRLRLKDGDAEGWRDVSRAEYAGCRVGHHYDGEAGICRGR